MQYVEMGGTSRTANGLSKLAVMRHGYWGGAREVGSIGLINFVFFWWCGSWHLVILLETHRNIW